MAGLQEIHAELEAADVRVVASSADGREGAEEMKRDEGLDFPILHGLDVDDMQERLGLYVHEGERVHLQPAQFILGPDGSVHLACYSSGKVGRLRAREALDLIESAKDDPGQ